MSNYDDEMWADYDRYEHTGECAEYFEDFQLNVQPTKITKRTVSNKRSPKHKYLICKNNELKYYFYVIVIVIILILCFII